MSDVDPNLVLHLALEETQDATTPDSSANHNDGKLGGAPQLVPDETFGSCLSFDGADDYVELTDAGPALRDQSFTVEAWVNVRAFSAGESAVIGTEETAPNEGLRLTVKDQKPYMSFTGSETAGATRLSAGNWFHLAWRFNLADGEQALFVNGQPDAASAGHAPFQGGGVVRAGRINTAGPKFFDGLMAHVRVYNRALTPEEIRQDMGADQTAAFAYRKTHPLGFNLYDADDQQALYINDDPTGSVLNLEIHNTSQQAISLARPDGNTPSADNYHFELRFRPGTLYAAALPLLALGGVHLNQTAQDSASWAIAHAQQTDKTDSIYFLNTAAGAGQGLTLDPDARLVLRLQNITADGRGGARGTRVELRYGQLSYPGSAVALTGSGVQQLSILNQEGKKTLPLHVDFVGSDFVLNIDKKPNTVKLRIVNILKDDHIPWSPGDGDESSRFTISFDAQAEHEQKEWALGTNGQVQAITIEATGGWLPDKKVQGDTTEWVVTHPTKTALGPGEDIELTLSDIVSSIQSGPTTLYLHYANIPGYWDGLFTRPLLKTPIVYYGSNVGIWTTEPREALDTGKGNVTGAAADYVRAQFALTGGGTVTWGGPGGRLKWSKRFIAISMECGHTFSTGHVNIAQPTSDLPKEYVYDGAPRSADADGVLLGDWEALYAVHEVGQNENAVSFRVVKYTVDSFYTPSNWILVAAVNSDDRSVKLGTGAFVSADSASAKGDPVPSGVIMMWWGDVDKIPPGWALCDGKDNRTPDLRDRFVVGAGGKYQFRETGGAEGVALNVSQLPAHSHPASAGSAGNHYHEMLFDTGSGGGESAARMAKTSGNLQHEVYANYSAPTKYAGEHAHIITVGNTGSGAAHENRPPFYALCFIMKLY